MIRFFKRVQIVSNLCSKGSSAALNRRTAYKWLRSTPYSSGRCDLAPFSSFPVFLDDDTKPRVLITRPDFPKVAIDRIEENCVVEKYEEARPMPREELLERIGGKHGLLCCLTDRIDEEVLHAAGSDLQVISTMSAGYDHIDLEECRDMGVQVGHTPGVSFDSVAEWTVTMMLCAGRNFVQAVLAVRSGEWKYAWDPTWLCGRGLTDAVVGIVGMGGIGQKVCQRVMPFGVKTVLYYDIFHPVIGAEQLGAKLVELKQLLSESDFVVCTVNLWQESEKLFDADAFRCMKPSAVFINTSRGEVVNQEDLYSALRNQTIRGAAIDVTDPEPLPTDHKLLSLPNIIVTPHTASAETNVRIKMAELASENLLRGLKGEELKTPVPRPKVIRRND